MSAHTESPSPLPGRRRRPRNPLRPRGLSVQRAFLALLLIAAFAVPAVAFLAGRAQYATTQARSRTAAAENHLVTARLEQNVSSTGQSMRGGEVLSKVSWTADDGAFRHGKARVQESGAKGAPTTIWLDAAGNPADAPASRAAGVTDALATGTFVLIGGFGVLLVGYAVETTLFLRSRMKAWARDWERTAPLWTPA
ncbi:Rv1733c family protein [Yinghuangia sp. YIM S09857]|uniref:Rv1733c family protein n=1 Tax=Yinghuangia sp. YIM S09857 TaxID=3436929 RepID=UPI003F530D45